jgi:hypothetical protein
MRGDFTERTGGLFSFRLLEMDRVTLYRKIKKYNLTEDTRLS